MLKFRQIVGSTLSGGDISIQSPDAVTADDLWTWIILDTDDITTLGTNVDTNLAFTPDADSHYIFEASLVLQTALSTSGVRAGMKWPSGMTENAAFGQLPKSQTTEALKFFNGTNASFVATTGFSVANVSYYGSIRGQFKTGASPSGDLGITNRAETAGNEARLMAGSWLRYRKL